MQNVSTGGARKWIEQVGSWNQRRGKWWTEEFLGGRPNAKGWFFGNARVASRRKSKSLGNCYCDVGIRSNEFHPSSPCLFSRIFLVFFRFFKSLIGYKNSLDIIIELHYSLAESSWEILLSDWNRILNSIFDIQTTWRPCWYSWFL